MGKKTVIYYLIGASVNTKTSVFKVSFLNHFCMGFNATKTSRSSVIILWRPFSQVAGSDCMASSKCISLALCSEIQNVNQAQRLQNKSH